MGGELSHGRASSLRCPPAGWRGDDGGLPGLRHLAQDRHGLVKPPGHQSQRISSKSTTRAASAQRRDPIPISGSARMPALYPIRRTQHMSAGAKGDASTCGAIFRNCAQRAGVLSRLWLQHNAGHGAQGSQANRRSANESPPSLKLRRASCYAPVEGGSLQILRSANGAKQDGAPRRVMMRTTSTP